MNFKYILWIILLFINHVVGEFLQMSLSSVNMSRVIRSISAITITACHLECAKEPACHDKAITERTADNQLPTCYLLKEDNGPYDEGGNVMTTIQAIGSGVRVDGQWSCWKSISACTVSCGGGTLNQTRDCDSPRPAYGGDNCTGPAERTMKCNEQNCPVDGGFSNWKNSTNCTKRCGNGTMEQIRDCDSPKPMYGGDDCKGNKKQTVKCNTQACPVNGGLSDWKNSTDCSKSCENGTLNQIRDCDSPKPEHGGNNCTGKRTRTVECNTQACPVNGGLSDWKNSTDCSTSCGNGTLDQIRDCDSPKPEHGGANCTGKRTRTVECNTQACPVVNVALNKMATQSSTYDVNSGPSKVVDGKLDNRAATQLETNPWWKVDMGKVRVIKYFQLFAVVHPINNNGLLIETREYQGESWILCKDLGDIKEWNTTFTCIEQLTKAQFLRIQSTKRCHLNIHEIEVFGY